MHGDIWSQFVAYGSTSTGLGYPTSDEENCADCTTTGGGRMNTMQNGIMAFRWSDDTAWAMFSVFGSSAKVFPASTVIDEFGDTEVTLNGSGFQSGEAVNVFTLTWAGPTLLASINADSSGNFSYFTGTWDPEFNGLAGTGGYSGDSILTFQCVGAHTSGKWLAGAVLG